MPTSDEELQKKAEDVDKLRQQVANAEATREQREKELANDITLKQLEAEEASLKARLAVSKDAGKVSNVRDGAAAPLNAVGEMMERAVAQQKAAEHTGKESTRATESTSSGTAGGDSASAASKGDSGSKKES